MTAKERFIKALNKEATDRMPVTTHHVMASFLEDRLGGESIQGFFDRFGLDPINWVMDFRCDSAKGEYYDPEQEQLGYLETYRICTDNWRFHSEQVADPDYATTRHTIITPRKELTMVMQANRYTGWASEHLIKEKSDIEILADYMTSPTCNVEAVNREAELFGERGLMRGHICCFDIFGQPGVWQDAACLYGIEALIMATFDDPAWVHEFLSVLQSRKLNYINSLQGAKYDILELGGGDASTTVISPDIFNEFVAPYDAPLVEAAHKAGQRIVYHTCGGMMPILEDIAAMGVDAMETFTPKAMNGDADLAEAKKRIGDRVCMIGGFDQVNYFKGSTPEQTRAQVRQCYEQTQGQGFILAPSDHFFDADIELIEAFADEARKCC